MRIQEMRAGSSLLRNRMEGRGPVKSFEMRSLLDPDLFPELDAAVAALTAFAMPEEVRKTAEADAVPAAASELDEPIWSVISFARTEASGLTYCRAAEWMNELALQGVAGLCIVTDEAAKNIKQ